MTNLQTGLGMTKELVLVDKKMKSAIALNSKASSLFFGVLVESEERLGSVRMLNHKDNVINIVRSGALVLCIKTSKDPNSIHFNEDLQSSSKDKRAVAGETFENYTLARSTNTLYGVSTGEDIKNAVVDKYETGAEIAALIRNVLHTEVQVPDYNMNNMTLKEMDSYNQQLGFVNRFFGYEGFTEDEFITSLNNAVMVDALDIDIYHDYAGVRTIITNPRVIVPVQQKLTLVHASVGKTRQGHAQYLITESNDEFSMDVPEFMKRLSFKPEAFAKSLTETRSFMDIVKLNSRIRLNNSTSIEFPLFEGAGTAFSYKKDFKLEVAVVNEDNTKIVGMKEETITVTVWTFENGLVMMESPDFYVYQEAVTTVLQHNLDGTVEFVDKQTVIKKNATDGYIMLSERLRTRFKETLNDIYGGFQFRGFGYQKGFEIFHPTLFRDLGVDILLFEGSRKANLAPYIKEEAYSHSILNFSREPKIKETSKLARQALINILATKRSTEEAFESSLDFWDKALSFHKDELLQVIGAEEINLEDSDAYNKLLFSLANSEDSSTVQFINANKELALSSATMETKVMNLLVSTMKNFTNGHAYVKDSYTRHMIVDPVSVVRYMKEGLLSVVKGYSKEIGIKEDNIVDVGKRQVSENKTEYYLRKEEEALLVRFPNLYDSEIRKVNKNNFIDERTESIYARSAKSGYFKGLVIFSLWDMNPEGMSGADFDGDIALILNDPSVVANFKKKNYFLDYSNIQQKDGSYKLIEGCPFSAPSKVLDVKSIVPTKYHNSLEKFDIKLGGTQESTVKYGQIEFNNEALTAENYDEFLLAIHPLMQYFILSNLKGNDIGKFTNILTTVTAMKSEASGYLRTALTAMESIRESGANPVSIADFEAVSGIAKEFKEEVAGFDNLQLFLTCAVRWEIDAAKHGGAYREELPFLELLEGITSTDTEEVLHLIKDAEETYNISLERLFVER